MVRRGSFGTVFVMLAFAATVVLPSVAAGQGASTAAIAGNVTDSTGSVLPGVTVEAESPALIERVRTAVTDGQGVYRVVALPPGTYSVTFTLPGFQTLRREGIELSTGFTAPANAQLQVGAVAETVIVTGASPVVDVQNTQTDNIIRQETLQALPTNQSLQAFATLTPGVVTNQFDVGGNRHERAQLTIAGRPQQRLLFDGVMINNLGGNADGQYGSYSVNVQAMQEVSLGLGTMSAEHGNGGVNINYIPREGGNTLSGLVDVAFGNGNTQWSNLNDEIRARGVSTAAEARKLWDYALNVGGPVVRDRLWFFGAARWWGGQEYAPGNFYNKLDDIYIGDPNSGVVNYEPDLSRRAFTDNHFADVSGRLTWQVARDHKLSWGYSFQKSCVCLLFTVFNTAPEANANANFDPVHLTNANWTFPASNRLLFEAGFSYFHDQNTHQADANTTGLDVGVRELVGTDTVRPGYTYNGRSVSALPPGVDYFSHSIFKQAQARASVSHVTGTNSFKAGFQMMLAHEDRQSNYGDAVSPLLGDAPVFYYFARGRPARLRQIASPHLNLSDFRELGLYVQDQLTFDRLTLNVGVRYDSFTASIPAQTRPAGPFVPAIPISAIGGDSLPSYHSLVPRLGAAYDLIGDGTTAIKASMGKYVTSVGSNLLLNYHPALRISTIADRTWSDANMNFVPDCDLANGAENGECGALNNALFGQARAVTATDPALLNEGRGHNWQATVALEQQILEGWGVEIAYDRTWYGGFQATDNRAVTPADYDSYCVTAPTHAQLPNGGGYEICGLYDINPAMFGRVDNYVTLQENFGDRSQVFNGVRISTEGRFRDGTLLGGGFSIGRSWDTNCTVIDSPQQELYCDSGPPLGKTIQFKLYGTYTLPWDVQTAATFRVVEGAAIDATLSYSNAAIASSLGRDLAACGASTGAACTARVAVPLYAPGDTLFEPRLVMLDWRISKIVRIGQVRLQGLVDFFNLLNTNSVLRVSGTFGGSWPRPVSTVPGRTVRLGAKVDW